MIQNAQFEQPSDYKVILRDSYEEDKYYGLDAFDCKYLKILQARFGCQTSYHTIPDRVKMEMAPYVWHKKFKMFVLDDKQRHPVQLNRLENMVVNYDYVQPFEEEF